MVTRPRRGCWCWMPLLDKCVERPEHTSGISQCPSNRPDRVHYQCEGCRSSTSCECNVRGPIANHLRSGRDGRHYHNLEIVSPPPEIHHVEECPCQPCVKGPLLDDHNSHLSGVPHRGRPGVSLRTAQVSYPKTPCARLPLHSSQMPVCIPSIWCVCFRGWVEYQRCSFFAGLASAPDRDQGTGVPCHTPWARKHPQSTTRALLHWHPVSPAGWGGPSYQGRRGARESNQRRTWDSVGPLAHAQSPAPRSLCTVRHA